MLKCDHVAEQASALLDGDLTFWQALPIRMHLLICKGCARFLRQMRATRALAEAAGRAQAKPANEAALDAILAHARGDAPPES